MSESPGDPHHRDAGTTPEDSREKDTIHLARVLESLEHYQPSSAYDFALALYFVVMLLALHWATFTRPVIDVTLMCFRAFSSKGKPGRRSRRRLRPQGGASQVGDNIV